MLFKTFVGQLKFVCYYPSSGKRERPVIFDVDINEWYNLDGPAGKSYYL